VTEEVRTEFKLDDKSGAAVKDIKRGFSELNEERKHVQEGFGDFARDVASTFIGMHLGGIVDGFKEMTFGAIEIAAEAQQSKHDIAGMIAGMQGIPWGEARKEASQFHEEIDDLGISLGVNADALRKSFTDIASYLGGTEQAYEQASDAVVAIGKVSRNTGMSVESIGDQFAQMAAGFVRPKSELFNLLQTTGIFGDKVKGVREGWQALTDDERIKRLNSAFEKLGSEMGEQQPTLTQMVSSIKQMGEQLLENAGMPVLDVLLPQFKELRDNFSHNRAEFEAYARTLGRDVGQWVKQAIDKAKEGFQYLRTHYEEIKSAIVEAFNHAKTVIDFILAHKEAIAIAFGAKTALDSGLGKAAVGVAGGIAKAGGAGAEIGGLSLGASAGGGLLGSMAALGAFALALGGVTLALHEFEGLLKITAGGKSDERLNSEAFTRAFQDMVKKPDLQQWDAVEIANFDKMRKNFVALAESMGEDARAAGELADAAYSAHQAGRDKVRQFDEAANVLSNLEATGGLGGVDLGPMVEKFSSGFAEAMKTGDIATEQYIAKVLANAKGLHAAFINSADLTGEGMESLADLVEGISKDLADKLRATAKSDKDREGAKAPNMALYGGQTFNLKQDFRDQDPDRIAVVFQNDIAKLAERRLQASTASVFGT
jgi:hypothetical protein